MAATITTIDGDILDLICHRYYGQHKGTVEAVLAANPGLAAIPQPYAADIEIILPDRPVTDRNQQTIALWE
ncbi:tail protein X [Pseudochelatococcus sp. G4_1912]|uniref:tail protein X n=1 Tax=Pseudochelatococcus sp. G4_1912 TaxID=3114288 RepID=UPI0039C6393B